MDKKLEELSTEQPIEQLDLGKTWILHVHGASNSQESRVGLILINSKGVVTKYSIHFLFNMTNNQSKYKALLVGLMLSKELGVKCLRIFTDS